MTTLSTEKAKILKEKEQLGKDKTELTESNTKLTDRLNAALSKITAVETLLPSIPSNVLAQYDQAQEKRIQTILKEAQTPILNWRPSVPKATKSTAQKAHIFTLDQLEAERRMKAKAKSPLNKTFPIFTPPKLEQIQLGETRHISIPIYTVLRPIKKKDAALKAKDIQPFVKGSYQSTIFRKTYGENGINWSPQKIARDIYQNFYDGHGHTLEGTNIEIERKENETYRVKVSGEGEFNHTEIEDLGGGTKSSDDKNAGGYGEGSKMFTIRLLAHHNVPKVTYRSSNWEMSFQLGDHLGQDTGRMYKSLKKVPIQTGNSIEFETQDQDLVKALLEGTNYFYHPGNPDFQNPTYENQDWGFQYLGLDKSGNFYLANQRFETQKPKGKTTEPTWNNGLSNLNFWMKRKPKKETLDYGRDRMALTNDDLVKIVNQDAVKTMTAKEIAQIILELKDLWSPKHIAGRMGIESAKVSDLAGVKFLKALLDQGAWYNKNLDIQFPEEGKYLALPSDSSEVSEGILQELSYKGYTLCHSEFANVGMKTVKAYIEEQRKHVPINPNKKETKRINLLKQAAKLILDAIPQQKHVIRELDIQQPIYLFNRYTERDMSNTLAEAITGERDTNYSAGHWRASKAYHGCWIDKNHLSEKPFNTLLATYLHEMTHQHGGDESSIFSYKMTDWLESLPEVLLENTALQMQLKDILKAWDRTI